MTQKIEYLDNTKFYNDLVEYFEKKKENPEHRIPDKIGKHFLMLSEHIFTSSNFRNYTFKEDMISDAVYYCLKYMRNFDPKKYTNPFGYFTRAVSNAFIQRIIKEKKYYNLLKELKGGASKLFIKIKRGDKIENYVFRLPVKFEDHKEMKKLIKGKEESTKIRIGDEIKKKYIKEF